MKSILFLTNFSSAANHAIRNFAKTFGPKLAGRYNLILINAWKQPRTGHFQMINLDEYLAEISSIDMKREAEFIINELKWPRKNLKLVSKKGEITDVVKQLTKVHHPELIVFGTKGTNLFREIVAGSTTGRILRQIKVPTLLIPESAQNNTCDKIVFATDLQECRNKDDFEKLTGLVRKMMADFLILHVYTEEKPNVDKFEQCMEPFLSGINYSFHYEQHVNIESGIIEFVSNMQAGLLALIGRKDDLLIQLLKHSVTQGIVHRASVPMLIIHE